MVPRISVAEPPEPPPRSRRTLLWVSTSYFGEGLPWSFLHQMAYQFLTEIRASKTQISSTSLLHLAVTFKFLWSPVVDLVGRMRTWVWIMQIVLGAGMLLTAPWASPRTLAQFWVGLATLAILHATHDIACDGFYLQALDSRAQALFVGPRNAAYRVAMLVGNVALTALVTVWTWRGGFSTAGVIMIAVGLVNAVILPRPAERSRAARASDRRARRAAFFAAYRSFLDQPKAGLVLSLMFFYRLGDIMMGAMSAPLLRDIGVDLAHRSLLNGLGVWAFIVGSLLGGAFIAKRGLERSLVPMTYLQNLAIPLYIGLAVWKPHFSGVIPIVLAEQLASGIGNASHSVFLMRRSRRAFSASHYAFATAIVSLGSTVSGFLSGPLNQAVGHPLFFTCAFIASIPSLILVWLVPKAQVE
jgi:PAT family beta-lactamase induction signal transducer AmpG